MKNLFELFIGGQNKRTEKKKNFNIKMTHKGRCDEWHSDIDALVLPMAMPRSFEG